MKYKIGQNNVDSVVLKALLVSRGIRVKPEVYEKFEGKARLSKNPLTCNVLLFPDGTVVQLTDLSFHMEYMKSMVNWDMLSQIRYLPQLSSHFSLALDQNESPTIYYDRQFVTQVFFPPYTNFYKQKTSSGLPFIGNAVLQGKDWLSFQLLWKCDYALLNEPCQYCFSGGELSSLAKRKKFLPKYPTPEDVADIVEFAILREKCANSIQITGGSSFDDEKEISTIIGILEAIDKRVGKKNITGEIVAYLTPPKDPQRIDKVFSAGADKVSCSLEIWDEELAAKIMPGKMKYTGRKRHLDSFFTSQKNTERIKLAVISSLVWNP